MASLRDDAALFLAAHPTLERTRFGELLGDFLHFSADGRALDEFHTCRY